MSERDILRRCRFSPYRKGCGPTFNLVTWYTGRWDSMGKDLIGYELREGGPVHGRVLFTGEDLGCSPCHAIDSDDTIYSLMDFLTLRPGDTDDEYFERYTSEQLEFCDQHAETLSAYVLLDWHGGEEWSRD